jgi:hypothetical protein
MDNAFFLRASASHPHVVFVTHEYMMLYVIASTAFMHIEEVYVRVVKKLIYALSSELFLKEYKKKGVHNLCRLLFSLHMNK